MRIEINAELPFSWCKSCTRRDMRTETMIADGEVYDSQTICENAPICEACEKARRSETPEEAKEASESLRAVKIGQALQEGFDAGMRIVEIGMDEGGGDDLGGVQYYCRACRRIVTTYRYKHTSGGKVLMECPACGELTVLPKKKGDNHGG